MVQKMVSKSNSYQKVDEFIKQQDRKKLSQGLKNLIQNAQQTKEKQVVMHKKDSIGLSNKMV